MSIFVFEPDLLFSSRFENLSHVIGQDFRVFTDASMLLKAARSERPAAFIISLDAIGPEAVQILVKLDVPVMGYYSHIHSETARAAVQSGVDRVVTVELSLPTPSHSFANYSTLGSSKVSSFLHVAFSAAAVVDRCFQNEWHSASGFMFEECSETFISNVA